jgi:hydrogenase maturation protease
MVPRFVTPRADESVLVLGIGNEILTDDGIGPKLVNDLQKSRFSSKISFQNASLGGLELLDLIRDYDFVVFLDAIKTGSAKPGTVFCFTPYAFVETLHLSNLHDINFLTALELGKRTGMKIPGNIFIIAVEIIEDRVFCSALSDDIREKYPHILTEVQGLLEEILMPCQ